MNMNASAMRAPVRRRLRRQLKDAAYRLATRLHRKIFTRTRGRILGTAFGMPVIELVTTGRKSGQARRTMLAAPLASPERVVLVGSFGGDDRHPAWYLNLRAYPRVRVTLRGVTAPMRARVATPEERQTLWPQVTAAFGGYATYQQRTTREVPLVILEPPMPAA